MAQTWPSSIYSAFYSVLSNYRSNNIQTGVAAFRTYLNGGTNPLIRVFVDGTTGFGHQVSSVNLIRRIVAAADAQPIAGLAYAGTIEIRYTGGTETRNKITDLLLPDANWQGNTGHLGAATLQLVPDPPAAADPTVNLGFTGGADHRIKDYGVVMKTRYFLLLQPYRWPQPNEIQFDSTVWPAIDLEKQAVLGATSFTQRAFFQQVDLLTGPQWDHYIAQGGEVGNRAEILRWLVAQALAGAFDLVPAYSIRAPRPCEMGTPASQRIVQLVAGYLDSQRDGGQPAAAAKPIVIVNLDDYIPGNRSNLKFKYIKALLKGNPTDFENIFLPKTADGDIDVAQNNDPGVQVYNARHHYMRGLGARQRTEFLWQNVTLQTVQEAVIGKGDNQVIFIQLGIVPQPIFNSVFASNTLPSVFEGQNTANFALNVGRPYFHVARPRSNRIQYPTTVLGFPEAAGQVPMVLQNVANQIHVGLDTAGRDEGKPTWQVPGMAPPAVIGQFVRTWRTEGNNGRYHRYFNQMQNFYHNPANDKFFLAVNYLNYVINGRAEQMAALLGQPPVFTLQEGAANDMTLDQLYAKLEAALAASGDDTINLADPTLYDDGLIGQILDALVTAVAGELQPLTVMVSELTREPEEGDISQINLTGSTRFFGLLTTVTVKYTAPEQKITADITFTAEDSWSVDGAPWIIFSKPFAQVNIANASIPSVGALGGTLEAGTEFDFSIQLPGAENTWLFQATFKPDKPNSIQNFYSMAGGINLVQSLPTPFNVLADVNLSQLELQYNFNDSTVDYLAFTMQTDQPVPLFDPIALNALTIQTTINNPGSLKLRKWVSTIQGEFAIGGNPKPYLQTVEGTDEESAIVQLSAVVPTLNFSGELLEGNINILELINTFIPGTPLPADIFPVITDFSFDYEFDSGNLASQMNMNTDMKFPSAENAVFTLEALNFNLVRRQTTTLGGIGASVILFESSPTPMPLEIGAQYQGDELGWLFSAEQSGDGVFLDQLLEYYFGPNWVSDQVGNLSFADLKISMQTGTSSWQFSGRTAEPWVIPFLPGLPPIGANVLLGYRGEGNNAADALILLGAESGIHSLEHAATEVAVTKLPLALQSGFVAPGQPVDGWKLKTIQLLADDQPGLYGEIGLNIYFNNIPATVFYKFNPEEQSFGLMWHGFTVIIENKVPTTALPELPGVGVLRADADMPVALSDDPEKHWIATFSLDDRSLGSMVEEFVSWATGTQFGLGAPWNVLNHISLSAFKLVWDFSTNQVTFKVDIGPIKLGFATIKSIGLNYDSQNSQNRKVEITLEGSFMWDVGGQQGVRFSTTANGDESATWDATKPEETPAPPGGGNAYLDLRLIAMGQHVSVGGLDQLNTVEKVIDKLRELPNNDPDEIPVGGPGQPYFNPDSSWLIATDFGVLKVEKEKKETIDALGTSIRPAGLPIGMPTMGDATAMIETVGGNGEEKTEYFVSLSIVFNDPKLYALRIALAGPAAKILAGLAFEIMYRQVSDTVGVYSSQIALPTAMRRLNFGTFTITLPVFGFEIYTNGDFKIDVGFPYNEDFSRSFTIEAIVYPGIPLLGSAGFYFGKLSSETSTDVPQATNGWFNPVIIIGFGGQLGVGKSISVGILEAGFSITAFGILQGVIAQWHEYEAQSDANQNQVQDSYYFSITGSFGVLGRLYGTINFAIVQANVDINVKAMATLAYISYEPIPISVSASVSVKVSVKINLGLFKIKISFSFAATVKATFTIENSGVPPWQISTNDSLQLRSLRMRRRLRDYQALTGAFRLVDYQPIWSNLQNPDVPVTLNGYFAPALTVAGDLAQQTQQLSDQFAAYVLAFFIGTEAPVSGENAAQVQRRLLTQGAGDLSFQNLCLQVTRWLIAAGQAGPVTAEEVDDLVISDAVLSGMYTYLDNSNDDSPIPADDINTFLNGQFDIVFALQTQEGEANATFFPAAPGLSINVPAYGEHYSGVNYTVGGYNSTSTDYAAWLREYFQALAVQVQEESDEAETVLILDDTSGPAVGSYVFQDYFTLIGKQMIDALQDGLRNFQYPLVDTETVQDIVDNVNSKGDLSGHDQVTAADLFEANPRHPLTADKTLQIQGALFTAPAGLSFDAIAALDTFKNAAGEPLFSGADLATANVMAISILQPGAVIVYSGKPDYTVQPDDSLEKIAVEVYQVTTAELIAGSNVVSLNGLLVPLASLLLPVFNYLTTAEDDLDAVAARFSVSLNDLVANEHNITVVTGLFDGVAEPYLDVPHLPQYRVGDLLNEAVRTLAVQHLGGMASRYYLHGLRLPTDGVTPKAKGIFVTEQDGELKLPDEIGMYALLGQGIALPQLVDGQIFNFTVSALESSAWMKFTTDQTTAVEQAAAETPSSSLTFELSNADDIARVNAVVNYATSSRLNTKIDQLGPAAVSEQHLSSYAFESQTLWQSGGSVPMPVTLSAPPQVPALNIWDLSAAMAALPAPLRAVQPAFQVNIGRYDQATGQMAVRQVQNFGFGSVIRFKIKQVPPVASSPSTERTYEIIGAGSQDILVLERILENVQSDTDYFSLDLLFAQGNADGQPAMQSYAQADTVLGISQVNLSTVTRPPSGRASLVMATQQGNENLLNTPGMFLRLLWEASITRAGGFYLYYDAVAEDQGLPDSLFNDQGEGEVAVVVLYQPVGDTEQGWLYLPSYVNCVATNEAVDSSQDHVYAQTVARPIDALQPQASQSLNDLAYAYYTDAAEIVLQNRANSTNPDTRLAPGATLKLENGLYEVPPDGEAPGGDLNAIAAWFNVTVDQIKAANPKIEVWPEVLPLFMAIRLPTIQLTVGASPGGDTFTALAEYYRVPVPALAAANANAPGILASDASLSFSTGPATRSAANKVGVSADDLSRTVPADIPDQPTADYAEIYLQHVFNMLGYNVVETVDFAASNMGLPAGPTNSDDTLEVMDKVHAPESQQAGDDWTYTQAIPYYNFAKEAVPLALGADPDSVSPYDGVGGLLQVNFAWYDLYGNTIVSNLSDPQNGDTTPLNQSPVITGYTDQLMGPGQWPAVSMNYQLGQGGAAGEVVIELTFAFDYNRYNPYESANGTGDENWQANAARDLTTYQQIHYQLNDLNGISMALDTSLFPAMKLGLTSAQVSTISDWAYRIQTFLFERSKGDSTTPPPLARAVPVTVDALGTAAAENINPNQIFELSMGFTIARRKDLVAGALRQTPGVGSVRSAVTPSTGNIEDYNNPADTRDLTQFAKDLTKALSGLGDYEYQATVGADRNAPPESQASQPLWVVRLGKDQANAIAYSVLNPGLPIQYAPRPLSNQLVSRDVNIYAYTTGSGIDFNQPTNVKSFTDIDSDRWLQQFLNQVDSLLSPRFVTPALILDAKLNTELLQSLLDSKELLAEGLRQLMIPVFADENPDQAGIDAAQEGFKQQMLNQLSQAFGVAAAVQFEAEVKADIEQQADYLTPRLYGEVVPTDSSQGVVEDRQVSLTTPKLALATTNNNDPADLTFMVSTSEQASLTADTLPLDLVYQGRNIEHQIGRIDGIGDGYLASSWLSFLDLPTDITLQNWPLDQALGSFEVPLVLRVYPQIPTMVLQESVTKAEPINGEQLDGERAEPAVNVDEIIKQAKAWTYSYTYSMLQHRLQDRIYSTVSFNLKQSIDALAEEKERDIFDDLGEFITVYPSVEADLNQYLAPITEATTDETELNNAKIALNSAAELIARAAQTAQNPVIDQPTSLNDLALSAEVTPDAPYLFSVSESGHEVTGSSGEVNALMVTVLGEPPAGIGTPVVQIPGYSAKPYTEAGKGYSYLYVDGEGEYLDVETGLSIPDRALELPELDILVRQDAITELYLTRNESFSGRKTAEPFVYTTPDVRFPNPLHPTNNVDTEIDMSLIGQGGSGNHVTRTLAGHLTALFTALFENTTLDEQLVQVAFFYDYATNSALSAIHLPVYFLPQQRVKLVGEPSENQISIEQLIQLLADSYQSWQAEQQPNTNQAVLRLDLTILSNLTKQPMPALVLTDVCVPEEYVKAGA